MKPILAIMAAAALTACDAVTTTPDTSPPGELADTQWELLSIGTRSAAAGTTLTFSTNMQAAGQGPCNTYFFQPEIQYPDFDAGQIGSTLIACADLETEQSYFRALERARKISVTDQTLELSGSQKLVFRKLN